jgi:hypothetical protein
MRRFAGLSETAAPFVPFQTKQLQEVLAHPEIQALAQRPEDEQRFGIVSRL